MKDPALQLKLNSFNKTKDKFDEAIEKDIRSYVDSLTFEDDPNVSKLLTPQMKKAALFEKIKADAQMPELVEFLDTAFDFIKTEGLHYLDSQTHENLLLEFDHASEMLEHIDLSGKIPEQLKSLLQISDEAMLSIFKIAVGAFFEEKSQESLSIFVLLTSLDATDSDYWFRLGIAAQKCGNMDQALEAYGLSKELNPEIIGARLFSAECFLNQKDQDSATNEIDEAKKIISFSDIDPVWLDLLSALEEQEKII